jgi:hypothetical protein
MLHFITHIYWWSGYPLKYAWVQEINFFFIEYVVPYKKKKKKNEQEIWELKIFWEENDTNIC